jgi:hypothetical protein
MASGLAAPFQEHRRGDIDRRGRGAGLDGKTGVGACGALGFCYLFRNELQAIERDITVGVLVAERDGGFALVEAEDAQRARDAFLQAFEALVLRDHFFAIGGLQDHGGIRGAVAGGGVEQANLVATSFGDFDMKFGAGWRSTRHREIGAAHERRDAVALRPLAAEHGLGVV